MTLFTKKIEIRWADLDPNFHVLHSKYYDFGAYCRTAFLIENGITPALMQQLGLGPILFREECFFRKEIKFGDEVVIDIELSAGKENFSRWSMKHNIWRAPEELAAQINVDGAWIDTSKRKLTVPPQEVQDLFTKAPRSVDYKQL